MPGHRTTSSDPPGDGKEEAAKQAALAYDTLASRFDEVWKKNAIHSHVGQVSLDLVTRALTNSDRLLEIGCGVGRETLEMASLGKRVVACDPSKESLKILEERASRRGLESRIETWPLSASEIQTLEENFGPHAFDGGFSSFALSYEPRLDRIPVVLASLLEAESPFVCSVFNRICLTELLLLIPIFLPRRGISRILGVRQLQVDRYIVTHRGYTVSEVKRIFASHFTLGGVWALPCILPPHYLHILLESLGGLIPGVQRLDRKLNGRWPFRYLGSHSAFVFKARSRRE